MPPSASDDQNSDPLFPRRDSDSDGTIPLQPPADPLAPMKAGGGSKDAYNSPLEHRVEPGTKSSAEESYSLSNPPPNYGETEQPVWQKVEQVKPDLTPNPSPLSRPKTRSKKAGSLIGCNLIVFVASVCVMVLEISASRLIAKHVGNSVYTWTSVIGVVLLGITVGNFIGGWLADRFNTDNLLPRLFFLASVSCFSVLWLDQVVPRERPAEMDWPLWVFVTVAQMFFLPAMILGTISPVVASIALAKRRSTGMTVGSVYAWGALGSIVGTFLTGFYLIEMFGTKTIIGGTAGTLALMGVLVASGQVLFRSAVLFGWIQFLLVTTAIASANEDAGRTVGGWIGRTVAPQDVAIDQLDRWYQGSGVRLNDFARKDLHERCLSASIGGVDDEQLKELTSWLRSGNRDDLTELSSAAIEDVVRHEREQNDSIVMWQNQIGEITRHMHELGVLLWLRDDFTGDYHDESNYSYIHVGTDFEQGDSVKTLQLDKLMHSYFNPAEPTKLYYEYEQIYAEITDRVAANWNRYNAAELPEFEGRSQILGSLPEWVSFDDEISTLKIKGAVSKSRRDELLLASQYGEYWLAIERLGAATRDDYWGGFSTERVEVIPEGVLENEFFKKRLSYEKQFETLNVYEELTEVDESRLCELGDAKVEAVWRKVVDSLYRNSRATSTFFIGGGGFVFPRWIEAEYPQSSRIDVAELDPAVKKAVQEAMGLAPDEETRIRTLIGDARNVTDDLLRQQRNLPKEQRQTYDFVYGDAFNDLGVPWHLTTLEYTEKIAELLHPAHGVYLVNVIDIWPRTAYPPAPMNEDDDFVGIAELPLELQPRSAATLDWEMHEEYAGIETQELADGTHRIGCRSRMSAEMRDRLKMLAPDSANFVKALDELYSRSHFKQSGRFVSSYVKTITKVFPNVYVLSTEPGPPSPERDTFIIAASMKPLLLHDLPQTGMHWQVAPFASLEEFDGVTRTSGQMDVLLRTAGGLVLTDDYAPVDALLKPVFVEQ